MSWYCLVKESGERHHCWSQRLQSSSQWGRARSQLFIGQRISTWDRSWATMSCLFCGQWVKPLASCRCWVRIYWMMFIWKNRLCTQQSHIDIFYEQCSLWTTIYASDSAACIGTLYTIYSILIKTLNTYWWKWHVQCHCFVCCCCCCCSCYWYCNHNPVGHVGVDVEPWPEGWALPLLRLLDQRFMAMSYEVTDR